MVKYTQTANTTRREMIIYSSKGGTETFHEFAHQRLGTEKN